jgi:hypothetical protein
MSEKARRQLLLPPGRKTAAEKATSLKHVPLEEFRDSPYLLPESQPTLLGIMAASIKRAMASAALDVPGANKTQIGRLVRVDSQVNELISIFGIPQVKSSVVRTADINHTPDIRTLAIIERWACRITVTFMVPQVTFTSLSNLLQMAGFTIGIGDGRPEKGKLDYGQFRVANSDDEEFKKIVAEGSREAQQRAMDEPIFYDKETRDLVAFFDEEVERRGREPSRNLARSNGKKKSPVTVEVES